MQVDRTYWLPAQVESGMFSSERCVTVVGLDGDRTQVLCDESQTKYGHVEVRLLQLDAGSCRALVGLPGESFNHANAIVNSSLLVFKYHVIRKAVADLVDNLVCRSSDDMAARERIVDFLYTELKGAAFDTLMQLTRRGALDDGDICSKAGRDELIEFGLAVRVCCNGQYGYTAATEAAYPLYKRWEEQQAQMRSAAQEAGHAG